MSAVLTREGAMAMAMALAQQGQHLRLYANDRAPGKNDTLASYTEAAFAGYRPAMLSAGEWRADGDAIVLPEVEFRSSADQSATVHGWYVTAGGSVIAAERFDTPWVVASTGDRILIAARMAFR